MLQLIEMRRFSMKVAGDFRQNQKRFSETLPNNELPNPSSISFNLNVLPQSSSCKYALEGSEKPSSCSAFEA